MKLKTDEVRATFAMVDAVPAMPAVESSQFVRMAHQGKVLTLSLSGMLWAQASLKTGDDGKWQFFADRRVLKAFLATAKGTEIDFACKGTQLVLKAGQTLDIPSHADVAGYERWTSARTFTLPDEWLAALETLVRYCPNIPGMEHVDAVSFEKGWGAVSTDTMVMAAVLDDKAVWTLLMPSGVAGLIKQFPGAKLCADKTGFGVVTGAGWVYQPMNDSLKKFPMAKIKQTVEDAAKVKPVATMLVSDLSAALTDAVAFLLDANESAQVTVGKDALLVTVDVHGGKFQRTVKATGSGTQAAVRWPVKQLQAWLAYLSSVKSDAEIGYAKEPGMNILLCKLGERQTVLVFADS
jgi:hypothetical protein